VVDGARILALAGRGQEVESRRLKDATSLGCRAVDVLSDMLINSSIFLRNRLVSVIISYGHCRFVRNQLFSWTISASDPPRNENCPCLECTRSVRVISPENGTPHPKLTQKQTLRGQVREKRVQSHMPSSLRRNRWPEVAGMLLSGHRLWARA
jgi:hypothetical protein